MCSLEIWLMRINEKKDLDETEAAAYSRAYRFHCVRLQEREVARIHMPNSFNLEVILNGVEFPKVDS